MRTLTFSGGFEGIPPTTERSWNSWEFLTDPDVPPSLYYFDSAQLYPLSDIENYFNNVFGVPYLHAGYVEVTDVNSQRSLIMLSVIDANGYYTTFGALSVYDNFGNFVGAMAQGTRTFDTDWGCYTINSATMGGSVILDARFMGYANYSFGLNYDLSVGLSGLHTILKELYGSNANINQISPNLYKFHNVKAPPLGSQFEWIGNVTNVLGSPTTC